jgi:hypothetical protein
MSELPITPTLFIGLRVGDATPAANKATTPGKWQGGNGVILNARDAAGEVFFTSVVGRRRRSRPARPKYHRLAWQLVATMSKILFLPTSGIVQSTLLKHMKVSITLFLFIALTPNMSDIFAESAPTHHWPFVSSGASGLILRGKAKPTAGVEGKSLALDGQSLFEVKDSAKLTHGDAGFSLTVWLNPYALGPGQQMIAAKNRYSLN